MNVTGYSSESAQSAIAANFTAFLSQTRSLLFLRTPPASAIRRSSPSRLSVPHGAELTQPLRLAQRRVSRNGGRLLVAFLLHPLAQRHLVHADIARHFYDRPTALDHEGHRLGLVLLSEATSSRSHDPYPSHEGQLHRLSGEPGTVQMEKLGFVWPMTARRLGRVRKGRSLFMTGAVAFWRSASLMLSNHCQNEPTPSGSSSCCVRRRR